MCLSSYRLPVLDMVALLVESPEVGQCLERPRTAMGSGESR